ncbi:MAG: DUF4292 domain-containing protein [Bacteroidota bacterium]|nr:DUF4292 domain-containing protein [Bacteroidota bacterium]
MKNIKYILFIIVLLVTSCALKKEYVIGDSKGITTKKIVKTIEQNQNKFTSLQARARIDYSSNNKIKTNTVTIRILAGEKVWISAPLGAIRLLITKDSIKYYNKLERNYIKTDFSYIEDLLGLNVTYDMLEKLLFGQPVLELGSRDFEKKLNKENNQTPNKLRSYVFKKKVNFDNNQFIGLFYINPYNFKLNSQKFFEEQDSIKIADKSKMFKSPQTFSINYKNYTTTNKEVYPKRILFLDSNNKSINIDMKSVVINKKLNIPFRIPRGYNQINVD